MARQCASNRALTTADSVQPEEWEDPRTEFFELTGLPDELAVRAWRPGDTFVPFSRRARKKLQDLFVDEHVPAERRHSIPVVLADGEVVWVAGVRRAEFARLSGARGERVVRLRYIEGDSGAPGTMPEA